MLYYFRPFTDADLPLVARWLKTPEVTRWWGDPEHELAVLAQDLDEPSMRQWIVEYRRRPFAYVSSVSRRRLAAGSPKTSFRGYSDDRKRRAERLGDIP